MSRAENLKTVESLAPAPVWRLFAELASIPRPSKKEEPVRVWIRGIAERQGWKHRQDSVGNMIVDVPAKPGCERAPLLILQSHLDMVCEKNADVAFDFDRDAIRLRIVGDEVRATGTTLGADNGIGVCSMLAAATSPDVRHGPLELLFTIDEETGLTGATAISPDLIRGRRLINLDSEEDDILYVGCAGGRTTTLSWSGTLAAAKPDDAALTITISGLRGGHSGCDIHESRGNANKLLARLLTSVNCPFRVASFAGGNKHNAIPREAAADVLVTRGDRSALQTAVAAFEKEVRPQFAGIDEGLRITVADRSGPTPAALSPGDSRRLVELIAALPDGVLGISRVIKGLVETSNNIAVVTMQPEAGRATAGIVASTRSSSAPHLTAAMEQIAAAARLSGWQTETSDGYPGWSPNPDSQLLKLCRDKYAELFGDPPVVTAIHAGLECGVIGDRVGGMDMISFGPTIKNPHSPDELVSIKSVQKFWRYLQAVLAATC